MVGINVTRMVSPASRSLVTHKQAGPGASGKDFHTTYDSDIFICLDTPEQKNMSRAKSGTVPGFQIFSVAQPVATVPIAVYSCS